MVVLLQRADIICVFFASDKINGPYKDVAGNDARYGTSQSDTTSTEREIQTELSVSVLCHIISGVILTKGV